MLTKILVETSSPELAGSVETLHTCHIGGTAELWCLHCSLLDRWDMLQDWHRGHTGCNYSATHTSGLGWWHHTGYRTHTCRTQERQRSFYPCYFKEDNAIQHYCKNPIHTLHVQHSANMRLFPVNLLFL